jgi:hypothetical protein
VVAFRDSVAPKIWAPLLAGSVAPLRLEGVVVVAQPLSESQLTMTALVLTELKYCLTSTYFFVT